jgi:hypothetical protein
MIGVQGYGLLDVSEESSVSDPYASNCVAPDQRYCIAGDDPILALQGEFGSARVW